MRDEMERECLHFSLIKSIHRSTDIENTHLCDVITIHRPSARTRDSASHNNLLATGSIPVVGSSRKTTGGSPTSDIAVLSFRLLPPLREGLGKKMISVEKVLGSSP